MTFSEIFKLELSRDKIFDLIFGDSCLSRKCDAEYLHLTFFK